MSLDLSVYTYKDYVSFLNDFLNAKRDEDVGYSQADFANELGISPPRVSQILQKKEGISVKKAKGIVDAFDFSPNESEYFFHLVSSQTAKSQKQKNNSKKFIDSNFKKTPPTYLNMNSWSLLDFEGWDVLWSFFELNSDFKDLKLIAKITSLSITEIESTLEKMKELKLIEIKDGIVTRLKNHIVFGNAISSQSIRNHHKRKLIGALKSLDSQSTDIRKNESLTFTLKKSDFKLLSDKVEKFVDDFQVDIDENNHDELATLTIALYNTLK